MRKSTNAFMCIKVSTYSNNVLKRVEVDRRNLGGDRKNRETGKPPLVLKRSEWSADMETGERRTENGVQTGEREEREWRERNENGERALFKRVSRERENRLMEKRRQGEAEKREREEGDRERQIANGEQRTRPAREKSEKGSRSSVEQGFHRERTRSDGDER
ncbi:hypothetical protein L484_002809 [Morus notabilis]|uniref:Uncharacterized protein n=1 Tax=Morus notabilis TaxID=981085 RepID=W9S8J5_9ROSA|nr:hypothetical protein L484_002809 [Morus notabilis]